MNMNNMSEKEQKALLNSLYLDKDNLEFIAEISDMSVEEFYEFYLNIAKPYFDRILVEKGE